jgi:hypothetical protein
MASREGAMARAVRAPAWSVLCFLLGLAGLVALGGCSGAGFGRSDEKPDPNLNPANYKTVLLAYLQENSGELENLRDASVSAPALGQFGVPPQERYFACLRIEGQGQRKEKLLIFFAGQINQYIDADKQCATAAYQPFPELVAVVAQMKGQKKR